MDAELWVAAARKVMAPLSYVIPMFAELESRLLLDLSGYRCGGESGIRTHGTLLTYTRFPSVRLKPLGHLSGVRDQRICGIVYVLHSTNANVEC